MKFRNTSRRTFLGATGAVGAAASLFPWLDGFAQTAAAGVPKLVLFYTPHGTVWDRWRPKGGETDFTFSYILEPLTRHRSKLVIIDGLSIDSPYDHRVPHTYDLPGLWCGSPIDTNSTLFHRDDHGVSFGWNKGTSVDQYIANSITSTAPFKTLEFGVNCGSSHPSSRMIYTGPAAPKHPLDTPQKSFDQIFADLQTPPNDNSAKRRKSVLDAVLKDLSGVSTKLSAKDRARLDAHATSLREIESALGSGPPKVCTAPTRPTGTSLNVTIDQQNDLLVQALACGQTRIASMQIRIGDNDGAAYEWVGISSGGHHSVTHDNGATAQGHLADLYRWYSERFALMLDKMAATPDGDGTSLLDNTTVIWGSEVGVGWSHAIDNVPFIVAGGGAGRVRTGRYLKVSGHHNRILVSACKAMGLSNVNVYGTMDDGGGSVPGLLI